MKNCERCQGRFDRIPAKLVRLKDGTRLDPNTVCPSCEVILVKEAKERPQTVERKVPRALLNQWERECLRKDAFTEAHLARAVAKRMRKRHRGDGLPMTIYRCRVAVDPVLFPDRAQVHWHIGGNSTR